MCIVRLLLCAGVTFTVDPVNGNPFKLLINATYGLGEAVVAGTHPVDTIECVRLRNAYDYQDQKATSASESEHVDELSSALEVEIGQVITASKQQVLTVKGNDSGIQEEAITDERKRNDCCLSKEQIIRLAKVALLVSLPRS